MSREYWENRYRTGDMQWEKGAPSPGLVDFLAANPDLQRGTVGIPGCGFGHDVRAFARAGFAAFGFDLVPFAIARAEELTRAAAENLGAPASCRPDDASDVTAGRSLTLPGNASNAGRMPALPGQRLPATFALADFLRDEPPQKFDWLFEHTLFCAIQPSERDAYVRAVLRWLKPGGCYLAVNYILIESDDGPPFRTSRAEQLERFSPHFELLADWTPRSYPNREGREQMFWWRRKS